MSDEKIKEIRERYAGYSLNSGNAGKANEDRGWLLAEVDRLRAALDVELLRLAACNVVAMADTPESAIEARKMKPEYRSATLSRVERRVDEVIALRAENERLRKRDEEWTQKAATWLASPEAERRLDGYRELAARVEGLTCERDEARAEVERLRKVYVLIATESAGIVEGSSIFEDKIAGCYASHQSADKAGENLGYVNWRIEEHTIISNELEGKP